MQHRLLKWTAAFFVLTTCACSRASHQANGFPVSIAVAPKVWCGDGDPIYVSALGNHRFAINDSPPLNLANLIMALNSILEYRAVKWVFVRADHGIAYSDFIEMMDAVYLPDVRVSVLTTEVEAQRENGGCLIQRRFPRAGPR
jgi:biopolymer transport protein ExbD